MSYRKFKADYIFTGKEILPRSFVLISSEAGVIEEIVHKKDAGDDIETFKGLLTPGFINAHCHLDLSHLKGLIPNGTGLVEFVQQVMSKRAAAEEEKFDAMRSAEQELYNSGTVAVGDICNAAESILIKQKSKIKWHNFIELSGFVDSTAEMRLANVKMVLDSFESSALLPKAFGTNCQLPTSNSLSPHAPYSVSKTLFQLLNNETANQLISIHNQECSAEDELYKNKSGDFLKLYKNLGIDVSAFEPTGKTSLQSWLPYFTNNQSIILVHNTFTTQEDIDFAKQQSASRQLHTANCQLPTAYCLCINANKYIELTVPPIDLLRKNDCHTVIGTDSYASNWQLNMLEEIKTIQHETAFSIPLQEILQWATINGARALQMDSELGSFEKGKQPGIVLIEEMNNLNLTFKSTAKRIL